MLNQYKSIIHTTMLVRERNLLSEGETSLFSGSERRFNK